MYSPAQSTSRPRSIQSGALQLNLIRPLRDLNWMIEDILTKQKMSGDALYKQVIKEAVEEARASNAVCFVAGTLVHTKEGLVPIEQIKVGDWVLSKSEEGGDLAYKQVTKTFVRHDQPVVAVPLIAIREFETVRPERAKQVQRASRILVMTPEHPVRTVMDGWYQAKRLGRGDCVVLNNGSYARVNDQVSEVLARQNPQHGIFGSDETLDCGWGQLIDFSLGYPAVDFRQFDTELDSPYPYDTMLHTVYNIEVEDYHTYFVGDLREYDEAGEPVGPALGVWVHNTCCDPEILNELKAEKPKLTEEKSERKIFDVSGFPSNGLCFVAGTLVHTKEGLVPIEQIKSNWFRDEHQCAEVRTIVHERLAATVPGG
ncbi:MAG: polymorphic toxin-type HINT domain-containing protein [Pseudomonadota bacterium]